jgi:hypothetical protein
MASQILNWAILFSKVLLHPSIDERANHETMIENGPNGLPPVEI